MKDHTERQPQDFNRAMDAVVGGWQFTGITTFQAGFPFSIAASDALSLN